jgi:putative Mg2+ transporter-C (MgtC) family protein
MLARLAVAGAAGGVVGLERSRRGDRPAGFRTLALVAMGAAAFMLVSIAGFSGLDAAADPARVGAQVATGVAFIGAGVVVRSGRRGVRGLTTAAAIWMSAAIGLAAGAGMYVFALGGAALTAALLALPRANGLDDPRSRDEGDAVEGPPRS